MENKKLLHDTVLVEAEKEEVTSSGLKILKEKDPSDISTGKVVKIGDKNTIDGIKVGSDILYQYGLKISVDGVQYNIVKTDDILFIL